MRIGLFTDTYFPDINGVAVSIMTLKQQLDKHGHETFVITTHPSLFTIQREGDILRLPGVELKKLYGYVMSSPIQIFALNDIKEMDLDIIHVHTEFGVGIYARMVGFILKIPIVGTYHTTYEDYTHYLTPFNSRTIASLVKKTAAKLSKLSGDTCLEVISPSEKTKELLESYHISKPISVIPTGIDLKRFMASSIAQDELTNLRKKWKLEGRFVILYVGRIAREKSIDMLIKAFPAVLKESAKSCLLIVGDGPQMKEYQNLAESLKVADNVVFVGKVTSEEIPKYYNLADVFVSASVTETQGLTYIEALASGLVVFARDKTVVEDIVYEGETGYFFDDEKSLANSLINYLALPEQKKKDIKSQAQGVVDIYGVDVFYERVIAVYQRVLRDYNYLYEIAKIRFVKDCVELQLKNRVDKLKILVSVNTYYELGIRTEQVLTNELVNALKKEEEQVKAYYRCLNRLKFKDRTTKEIYNFLTGNTELGIEDIQSIVEDLQEQGFIDDRRYVLEYFGRKRAMMLGNNRIINNLKKKGISGELIKELMIADEDEELEIALLYAQRISPTIKERSLKEKQQILRRRLLVQGFSSDIIEATIKQLNFSEDKMKELENLVKIAEKAKLRYQRKYRGYELRNRIFRYLLLKGYRTEDIYVTIDNMELEDEKN